MNLSKAHTTVAMEVFDLPEGQVPLQSTTIQYFKLVITQLDIGHLACRVFALAGYHPSVHRPVQQLDQCGELRALGLPGLLLAALPGWPHLPCCTPSRSGMLHCLCIRLPHFTTPHCASGYPTQPHRGRFLRHSGHGWAVFMQAHSTNACRANVCQNCVLCLGSMNM